MDDAKRLGRTDVDHPEHYQGAFECIDEMVALFGVEAVKAFCRCNVYKYRYRADKKGGATDIAKANEPCVDCSMPTSRRPHIGRVGAP